MWWPRLVGGTHRCEHSARTASPSHPYPVPTLWRVTTDLHSRRREEVTAGKNVSGRLYVVPDPTARAIFLVSYKCEPYSGARDDERVCLASVLRRLRSTCLSTDANPTMHMRQLRFSACSTAYRPTAIYSPQGLQPWVHLLPELIPSEWRAIPHLRGRLVHCFSSFPVRVVRPAVIIIFRLPLC